jgi:hypothetical protein
MPIDRIWEPPFELFERMDAKAESCLRRHAKKTGASYGDDCYVRGDYLGWSQVDIFIGDLKVLTPALVKDLRKILRGHSRWQINVVIAANPTSEDWPDTGMFVREHEIIDGLQRAYFPPEFQSLAFEGARPGTVND